MRPLRHLDAEAVELLLAGDAESSRHVAGFPCLVWYAAHDGQDGRAATGWGIGRVFVAGAAW